MKIISIEPTPSPNAMKVNVDEGLPVGVSFNYGQGNKKEAPGYIRDLLAIQGVKSVFQVLDFISIERHPKADWASLLAEVKSVLVERINDQSSIKETSDDAQLYGEVLVSIQKLKRIPLQIKLTDGSEELRVGLPERFTQAAMEVQTVISNYIYEREWVKQNPRYGEMPAIAEQVKEEIEAAYDQKRLQLLVERAIYPQHEERKNQLTAEEVRITFEDASWEKRYAVLDQFEPTFVDLDILESALNDSKGAIRRLAVVYLGLLGGKTVLPYLYQALADPSAMIRRTAGDVISDLGDSDAVDEMCKALKDKNKLVRWRAARFLFEVGNDKAISALKEATNDPEFEVKMQVKMALERIMRGEEASGTVWQQMTKRSK